VESEMLQEHLQLLSFAAKVVVALVMTAELP
jgi:hypothetical protein